MQSLIVDSSVLDSQTLREYNEIETKRCSSSGEEDPQSKRPASTSSVPNSRSSEEGNIHAINTNITAECSRMIQEEQSGDEESF